MRKLLTPMILTLALAVHCCCEKGITVKKEVAHAFVKRQKRFDMYEWYSEYYKSPMEQMRERCESYPPCDYLSDQIGFPMAYNRFFGRY
ncbi:osteocalcin-like isoform X2 [Meleagris gallopavo]|uniref:osteocalcin-like isoform X2 n=1 Tax=Meleagris gallopavo TaxID=9103 RepID=UPI000549ADF7|nr:osteocalcin-like isoform X2 [Meleagris gallopavo]